MRLFGHAGKEIIERVMRSSEAKNRGKPCYQWSVAFVRGEMVFQKLNKGNSHGISCFKEMVESVAAKLEKPISIIRVDGGYFSADTLDWTIERGYQIVTIENFFKESKNPFNSGKIPSQKFRANEAYLQFVAIAYNCYSWFKKNFFHQPGKLTLWRPQELN